MPEPDAKLPNAHLLRGPDPAGADPAKTGSHEAARRERRAKQADRYLERARSHIDTAGKLFIAVLLTTSAIWFFKIEPALAEVGTSADKIRAQVKEIQQRSLVIKSKESSESERSRARDSQRDRQAEVEKLKKKFAEKVPVDLPGFKLEVSLTEAPYVWSALLFWLVSYMAWTRVRVLRLCAKALSIQVAELGIAPTDHNELLLGAPWWLKPPPADVSSETGITREDLLLALGWRSQRRFGATALWMVAIATVALQLHFCWLEAQACWDVQECGDGALTPLRAWRLIALAVGFLVLTCWALWFWVRPSVLSAKFDDSVGTGGVNRRDFLVGAAPLIPALVLIVVLCRRPSDIKKPDVNRPDLALGKQRKNPRFAGHRKAAPYKSSLPRGFHKNRQSEIIHWVTSEGTIRAVSKIGSLLPSEESQPVRLGKEGRPRVHLATASAALGRAAIERVDGGKFKEGCDLLAIAISHDERLRKRSPGCRAGARSHRTGKKASRRSPSALALAPKRPDFGVYDALAVLAVRHDLAEYLTTAIASLKEARSHYPAGSYSLRAIDERLAKWENSASAWHRKTRGITK
jgi:hypothetical protein